MLSQPTTPSRQQPKTPEPLPGDNVDDDDDKARARRKKQRERDESLKRLRTKQNMGLPSIPLTKDRFPTKEIRKGQVLKKHLKSNSHMMFLIAIKEKALRMEAKAKQREEEIRKVQESNGSIAWDIIRPLSRDPKFAIYIASLNAIGKEYYRDSLPTSPDSSSLKSSRQGSRYGETNSEAGDLDTDTILPRKSISSARSGNGAGVEDGGHDGGAGERRSDRAGNVSDGKKEGGMSSKKDGSVKSGSGGGLGVSGGSGVGGNAGGSVGGKSGHGGHGHGHGHGHHQAKTPKLATSTSLADLRAVVEKSVFRPKRKGERAMRDHDNGANDPYRYGKPTGVRDEDIEEYLKTFKEIANLGHHVSDTIRSSERDKRSFSAFSKQRKISDHQELGTSLPDTSGSKNQNQQRSCSIVRPVRLDPSTTHRNDFMSLQAEAERSLNETIKARYKDRMEAFNDATNWMSVLPYLWISDANERMKALESGFQVFKPHSNSRRGAANLSGNMQAIKERNMISALINTHGRAAVQAGHQRNDSILLASRRLEEYQHMVEGRDIVAERMTKSVDDLGAALEPTPGTMEAIAVTAVQMSRGGVSIGGLGSTAPTGGAAAVAMMGAALTLPLVAVVNKERGGAAGLMSPQTNNMEKLVRFADDGLPKLNVGMTPSLVAKARPSA
ncbi:hypothetical protein HDU76_006259 [Blyttiomyces sp. JEL0837]|nr:hypothetical protein HDU76_006259 [Blyttiomyces sp. JEL0837]